MFPVMGSKEFYILLFFLFHSRTIRFKEIIIKLSSTDLYYAMISSVIDLIPSTFLPIPFFCVFSVFSIFSFCTIPPVTSILSISTISPIFSVYSESVFSVFSIYTDSIFSIPSVTSIFTAIIAFLKLNRRIILGSSGVSFGSKGGVKNSQEN